MYHLPIFNYDTLTPTQITAKIDALIANRVPFNIQALEEYEAGPGGNRAAVTTKLATVNATGGVPIFKRKP